MNTNARAGPSNGLRRTAARTASSGVPTAVIGATRPASTVSTATVEKPSSRVPSRPPSRPPSRNTAITNGLRSAAAPTTQLGLKRKVRTASGDADKDTAKRPTLSSAFSAHISQGSTQRQLLAAEAKVSELENTLRERDARIERLEADLRTIVEREESERTARENAEKELTSVSEKRVEEVSDLKKQLSELAADQEELHDAYEQLLHSSSSEIASLKGELEDCMKEVSLLQSERDEADVRARELDGRVRELEETLEDIGESGLVGELEDEPSDEEEAAEVTEGDDLQEKEVEKPKPTGEENIIVIKEENLDEYKDEEEDQIISDGIAVTHEPTHLSSDGDSDIDADGEIDDDENMSVDFAFAAPNPSSSGSVAQVSATPPRTNGSSHLPEVEVVEIPSTPSSPPAHSAVQGEPELEFIDFDGGAYPDPGAPPPYTVSSPTISPSPILAREEDDGSIASSRSSPARAPSPASSAVMPATPLRRAASGTPISIVSTPASQRSQSVASSAAFTSASAHRPDPLAHVRQRLRLRGSPTPSGRSSASNASGTPGRRRLSARRLSVLSSSLSAAAALSASAARERANDIAVVRAELARQHTRLTQLEAERVRLSGELTKAKERAGGTEVLREEVRGLRREAEAADRLRRRVAELEESQTEMAKKEDEWRTRALKAEAKVGQPENGEANAIGSPARVAQQLASLRRAHASLLDETGQLKATLRARDVELEETRSDTERAEKERDEAIRAAGSAREAALRNERERVLAEREVTFLKSLIASYKSEDAVEASMNAEAGIEAEAKADSGKDVSQLEALLEEYKSTNASLKEEIEHLQHLKSDVLGRAREEGDQYVQKAAMLEEALKSEQAEASARAERIEALEQQLFELGGEIGAGRHVPPKTRVLSLRGNPAETWADTRKEVLDRLKAENEALLARIADIEVQRPTPAPIPSTSEPASTASNAATVPRASYEVLSAETADLRRDLAAREKRLMRLQQVFQAKSDEFKDALAALLGLKVAFYPNGQVRITSVYDLRAAFVFQPLSKSRSGSAGNENGTTPPGAEGGARMQLIAAGEGVPDELDGLMSMWIRDEMSIPCFLASVTLECYDRWKREGSNQ